MEEKSLNNFQGKRINFIYNGIDLPTGEIPPIVLTGIIQHVDNYNRFEFISDGTDVCWTLTTSDVDLDSIIELLD